MAAQRPSRSRGLRDAETPVLERGAGDDRNVRQRSGVAPEGQLAVQAPPKQYVVTAAPGQGPENAMALFIGHLRRVPLQGRQGAVHESGGERRCSPPGLSTGEYARVL